MSKDAKGGDMSVSDKFKKFLKIDKKNISVGQKKFMVTEDIEKQLGKNSPIATRILTSKDILEKMKLQKLERDGIGKIWHLVKDIMESDENANHRSFFIKFLTDLTTNFDLDEQNRAILFQYISNNYETENTMLMFDFLSSILNSGKSIEGIEAYIQSFTLKCIPYMLKNYHEPAHIFQFLTNLVKHNSAYLNNDDLMSLFVWRVCHTLLNSVSDMEIQSCFVFLEALIAFSYIPPDDMERVISTLSKKACGNNPVLIDSIWEVLKKYLFSGAANTIVHCMGTIIESSIDTQVVCGCIILLTHSIWSKNPSPDITLSYWSILPIYITASEHFACAVMVEVARGIRKLIVNKKVETYKYCWDQIMKVLTNAFNYAATMQECDPMLHNVLSDILAALEVVVSGGHIPDNLTSYYDLAECSCCIRPVPYVVSLLDHKLRGLSADDSLISTLVTFMNRYFIREQRSTIRLHMLLKAKMIFDKYRVKLGEDICREVFAIQLDSIEKDEDLVIRQKVVSFLVDIVLRMNAEPVLENLLYFIHKIVLAPFDKYPTNNEESLPVDQATDITDGVNGLILIMKKKIWQWPSCFAIQAYQTLMSLLETHYRYPKVLKHHPDIRRNILELIFEMRANTNYNLGFPNCHEACIPFEPISKELDREIGKYSPYIIVDHKHGQRPKMPSPLLPVVSSPDEESEKISTAEVAVAEEKCVPSHVTEEVEPIVGNVTVETETAPGDVTEQTSIPGDIKDTIDVKDDCPDKMSVAVLNVEDVSLKSKVPVMDGKPLFDKKPTNSVRLSLTKAAQIVLVALKKENEWPITQMMLEKLPTVLESGALILSKDGNDIDYLATILCTLVSETRSSFSEKYIRSPDKFNASDFNAYIYPVLARLASYHEDMGSVHQGDIIKVLQFGILSKSCPLCVSAMTTCVLEMRQTMVKHLRDVMICLSKISATKHNAPPTLEFLSTLLHLPRVYSDFSPDQYMSVFAICIPYTNPFKFNHYIVSLAYHVIAMWFLKCRLPYRKQFVNFITKNLNNILVQESSDRRSSGSDRQTKQEMVQFHKDLRETLVDFMARYCFDSYSPTAKRSPVAEMLVECGQKQMWLVGTRIITVTTSGCSQRPMIRGFCDKCHQLCGDDRDLSTADSLSQAEEVVLGRRHKSEFHRSVSHEVKTAPQTKDDLHVENQSSNAPRYMSFLSQEGNKDGINRKLSEDGGTFLPTDPLLFPNVRSEIKQRLCACWCRGWAEILIRQPTGDVAWMMRIQNDQTLVSEDELLPFSDLSNLFFNYEQQFMATYGEGLPGVASADSDIASESGLTTAQSNEWSGSALSSGDNSGASSELKLNQDPDKPTEGQSAVSYSLSNPEVNLKLAEAAAESEQSLDKSLELDAQGNPTPRLRSTSSVVRRSSSIVGCPSPSAAPFSGTRHASAAQMKSTASAAADEAEDASLQPMLRGGGHTISEMNPASRASKKQPAHRRPALAHTGSLSASVAGSSDSMFSLPADSAATSSDSRSSGKKAIMRGISPSAVFLQLYYQGSFGGGWMRPIYLPSHNEEIARSVRLFDLIKPQENHKIAVVYVGPNQRTELEIFKNQWGSGRYTKFLGGLGQLHSMKDLPPNTYLGGYDRTGVDGDEVYMWNDQIMQVVFHVSTMLPNAPNDAQFINKKRHIGNDYVTIVYNDSKYPYQMDTIKSHFNHSLVEIRPTDRNTNLVITHCKPEVGDLFSWKPTTNARMVSDISLPVLVRQLAVHANLASMVSESLKDTSTSPYSSNWLERLRRIRKLREKAIGTAEAHKQEEQHAAMSENANQMLDFTDIIDVERSENKDRGRNRLFSRR